MAANVPISPVNSLNYLRDCARSAHLDGDGVLANHLSSIALEMVRAPELKERDVMPVHSWAWAVIFSLYWLTDSYMLDEVRKALEAAVVSSDEDAELLKLLKAYDWLIRQPLDPDCKGQKHDLTKAKLGWMAVGEACEHEVLLTHCIELLWYRDPRGRSWSDIATSWERQVPVELQSRLRVLERRLRVQTTMVVLGAARSDDVTIDRDLDAPTWVPVLWRAMFDNDSRTIDDILLAETPKHEAETPTGRLLFDLRHYNRIRGEWGDPVAIGLTRRRLITNHSPELAFGQLREGRAGDIITKLFLGAGNATDRFFGLTLGMLLELDALRRWDARVWCSTVEIQARLNGEIFFREPREIDFADRAIRCAVGAIRLNEKEHWCEASLAAIEFLPAAALTALVRDLLNTHPAQYHSAKVVFGRLGDAIPSPLYLDFAKWAVRYVSYCESVDRWYLASDTIAFLAPFLRALPESHEAWSILWAVFEPQFSSATHWKLTNRVFREFLLHAPLEFAGRAVELALAVELTGNESRPRWEMLTEIASSRPEISSKFGAAVVASAPRPVDQAVLRDQTWAQPYLKFDEAALRAEAREHLERILDRAVVPEDRKEFEMLAWGWDTFCYVQWEETDLGLVQRLLATVDQPRVLRNHAVRLLEYLCFMVRDGPVSFCAAVEPYLTKWLKSAPSGIDPMEGMSGPLSTIQHSTEAGSLISNELTRLAISLRSRIGTRTDDQFFEYVMEIAIQPVKGAIGGALQLALGLAIDHPNRAAELFSMCQALMVAAKASSRDGDRTSGDLMDAFRGPTLFTSENAPNPADRSLVHQLAVKLEPLILAIARSTDPGARAQMAEFLCGLKARDALTPRLANLKTVLLNDPRATIRKIAEWEPASESQGGTSSATKASGP